MVSTADAYEQPHDFSSDLASLSPTDLATYLRGRPLQGSAELVALIRFRAPNVERARDRASDRARDRARDRASDRATDDDATALTSPRSPPGWP